MTLYDTQKQNNSRKLKHERPSLMFHNGDLSVIGQWSLLSPSWTITFRTNTFRSVHSRLLSPWADDDDGLAWKGMFTYQLVTIL